MFIIDEWSKTTAVSDHLLKRLAILAISALCLCLTSAPVRALDCAKAVTQVEHAICANQALLDADKRMSDRYKRLSDRLTPDARQALRQSQRLWLKRRGWCEHSDKPISDCILRETVDRARVLVGEPETGPGTGNHLQPVFLVQQGSTAQYEVDVALLRFAKPTGPGENAFNTTVNDLLAKAPMGPLEEETRVSRPYSHQLSMTVPFASPAFISAKLFTYEYTGGAHGNSSTRNINIDLKSGNSIRFDDLFKQSSKPILVKSCFAQIQEEKRNRFGKSGEGLFNAEERRQIVSDTISDMVNWSFRQGKASVVFDPYAIGAYAEGRYECRFAMNFLQAVMLPTSALAPTGD